MTKSQEQQLIHQQFFLPTIKVVAFGSATVPTAMENQFLHNVIWQNNTGTLYWITTGGASQFDYNIGSNPLFTSLNIYIWGIGRMKRYIPGSEIQPMVISTWVLWTLQTTILN